MQSLPNDDPEIWTGDDLRALRMKRGRTVRQFAEEILGSPERAWLVGRIERGERLPPPDFVRALEDYVNAERGSIDFDYPEDPDEPEPPLINRMIAEYLRGVQEKSGLTQQAICVEIFGTKQMQPHWSRWRRGIVAPQLGSLLKIIEWSGVPFEPIQMTESEKREMEEMLAEAQELNERLAASAEKIEAGRLARMLGG